jgi:hypothetical protein
VGAGAHVAALLVPRPSAAISYSRRPVPSATANMTWSLKTSRHSPVTKQGGLLELGQRPVAGRDGGGIIGHGLEPARIDAAMNASPSR